MCKMPEVVANNDGALPCPSNNKAGDGDFDDLIINWARCYIMKCIVKDGISSNPVIGMQNGGKHHVAKMIICLSSITTKKTK